MFHPAEQSLISRIEVWTKLTAAQLNMSYNFVEPVYEEENVNLLKDDVYLITFLKYVEYFHHFRCYFDTFQV